MASINTFAERQMQMVGGQMPLPQSVFRSFLSEVGETVDALDAQPKFKVVEGDLIVTIADTDYKVTITEVESASTNAEE